MPQLQQKLELIVSQGDVDAIDLYRVARILQVQFPDRAMTELAWHVAQLAIERGARYLIWEPPNE